VKVTKKLMLVTSALVLPISAVILVGATSASAARSSVPGGTITCSKVKGTITFNPPETTGGTKTELTTFVKVTVSKCKNAGGATAIPKSGSVDTNIATGTGTNDCSALSGEQDTSQTLNVTWDPSSDGSSSSTYSNYESATSGSGDAGFELPDPSSSPPGTGSTSGSYSEASGSTATAFSNKTATQIFATCNGKKGLKSIAIKSGSTTL
jgi:hypothetical protein